MASAAQIVENVVSKVKDYDLTLKLGDGQARALEYSEFTLPGRAEATTYNLVTNLRNIQESAGDGEYNAFVVKVPLSLASYKQWHDLYGESGTLTLASTVNPELALTFNVTLSAIGDFTGSIDAINPIDITLQMTGFVEEA